MTSGLSPDARERLAAYVSLVRRWSSKVDLVAPHDLERFESRHVEDSLRLLPLLAEVPPGPAVDVGSGAGLPGIPLAIASERPWRLLEPRRRRAAFLEEVVRALDLDCEVITLDAESAARVPRLASGHALATARALAPPARAFALTRPLVAPGGVAAVYIGASGRRPVASEVWAEGVAIIRRTAERGTAHP